MDYITKIVLRPLAYIFIVGCTILCSGCAGEHVTTGAVQRISAAEQEENLVAGIHVMEQESIEKVQPVGKGRIAYDNTALTEEQSEVLKNFMDVYFDSLAGLSLTENEDLYENNTAYEADTSSMNFQISLRELAKGADYSLLSYDYVLRCIDVVTEENGDVTIQAREDTTQIFAQTPDIESKKYGGYHTFVLKETESGWKIARHVMFDTLYLILWSSEEPGRMTDQYIQSMPDYLALIQDNWQERMAETEEISSFTQPERVYDREAAAAYAKMYIEERNPQWADYTGRGGNCQNFVSQSLLAGGIPMDTAGNSVWKWFGEEVSNNGSHGGRSSSWTGVDQFVQYARGNEGYGLLADTSLSYRSGETGDVLAMGTEGNYRHAVMISNIVQDEKGQTVDYLVHSNTGNLENYPASLYGYPEVTLIKVLGWNS